MISNAVCYRSYLTLGLIRVTLFDDRLEVTPPGYWVVIFVLISIEKADFDQNGVIDPKGSGTNDTETGTNGVESGTNKSKGETSFDYRLSVNENSEAYNEWTSKEWKDTA